MIRSKWAWVIAVGVFGLAASLGLIGCAAVDEDASASAKDALAAKPAGDMVVPAVAQPSSATPVEQAPPSVAEPVPAAAPDAIEIVVQRAGERLFNDAQRLLGEEPRDLMIDPFIDAHTGQQTLAGVAAAGQLARLVSERLRHWTVRPFARKTLAAGPLLLIGTLSPVALSDAGNGPPDAYRLWLTLVDLRTGQIVAKRLDRATLGSVNAEPTAFFRDSPTWHLDRTTLAYVKSCQVEARVGERIDPLYLWRLPATALLNEAIVAFHDKKYAQARRLFVQASEIADPDDMRTQSGRYQTSWRLGAKDDASQELKRLVSLGLAAKSLPLKILFQPGSTVLLGSAERREQSRQWLREVARQASAASQCLQVIGHTSRSASQASALDLSQRRAATVRWLLAQAAPTSSSRFTAQGVGWGENLVGLGSDDQIDALDRRIEFRVVACP